MDNTIDILCTIDAETLVDMVKEGKIAAGSIESPTSLGSWGSSDLYIYMITEKNFVVNNQAKSELKISTRIGDNVRWKIDCPSNSQSCILYSFRAGQGAELLTPPQLMDLHEIKYINDQATTIKEVHVEDSVWQSTVVNTGDVQYSWSFQLVDNTNGKVIGYFTWDPFISICEN